MTAGGWLAFGSAVALLATGGVLVHYSFRPWWRSGVGVWLWAKMLGLVVIFAALFVRPGLTAWAILVNVLAALQVAMAILYARAQRSRRRRERDIDSSISGVIIES